MTVQPVLEVDGLSVRYGRLTAVRDLTLSIAAASIVGIIGPNGAGKSTTLAAIAGGVTPSAGTVRLNGAPITGLKPEEIARRGISLVPEGRHAFAGLTVEENLLVGSFMRGSPAWAAKDMQRMLDLFPRLRERRHQPAGKLSGGEQQMLVLARALMTHPSMLLIDEPSLGLAPKVVDEVYEIILAVRQSDNLTLLINEQSSKRIMKYCDEVHVLREGSLQLSGPRTTLTAAAISDAYFGVASPAPAQEGAALHG